MIDVKANEVPSYTSPESVERFIDSLQRLKIEPRTRNYLQHIRITTYGMAEICDRLRALLAENADLRRQITELQGAQRERELRLISFAQGMSAPCRFYPDPVRVLDAFNTQEPKP